MGKFATVIIIFIMILFAGVQMNDPDPLIWISVYGSVALVGIFKLFGVGNIWVNRILILAFIVGIGFYIPHIYNWLTGGMPSVVDNMKAETPYVELVREGGGLFVALLCLLYVVYRY